MEKISQSEPIEGFEDEPDQMEVVLDEDEPEVVYEDVPDENELPAGWEDNEVSATSTPKTALS